MPVIVTFDVFSALTDSRTGGSAFLQDIAGRYGWPVDGSAIYDRWDATNKERHRAVQGWVPFAELSAVAMSSALSSLGLPDDSADSTSAELLGSMVDWPLWPDVTAQALQRIGAAGLGLLSNIDDALLADTAVMRLGVFDPALVVTSERARAYKPAAALYAKATELLGPFVHVASSARDVRGAVSAGIRCIRLQRAGHSLDASGPTPRWTVDSITALDDALAAAEESDA
jgi:2-haloacid dehalogenase